MGKRGKTLNRKKINDEDMVQDRFKVTTTELKPICFNKNQPVGHKGACR